MFVTKGGHYFYFGQQLKHKMNVVSSRFEEASPCCRGQPKVLENKSNRSYFAAETPERENMSCFALAKSISVAIQQRSKWGAWL